MSIEKLIGDLIAAIDRNTAALQAASTTSAAPAAKAAKAKPPVEEAAPSKQEAAAAEAPAQDTPLQEETAITRQDVTDVVLALGKAGRRDALVKLLGEYGASKASALADDQLGAFHAAATKLLGV